MSRHRNHFACAPEATLEVIGCDPIPCHYSVISFENPHSARINIGCLEADREQLLRFFKRYGDVCLARGNTLRLNAGGSVCAFSAAVLTSIGMTTVSKRDNSKLLLHDVSFLAISEKTN